LVVLHVFCLKTTQAARVRMKTDQKRGQVNVGNLGHYIMKHKRLHRSPSNVKKEF